LAFEVLNAVCIDSIASYSTMLLFIGRAAMGLAGKIVEGAQALKSDLEES
jgi:hypothetical protein